jgi:hypothetical protein
MDNNLAKYTGTSNEELSLAKLRESIFSLSKFDILKRK